MRMRSFKNFNRDQYKINILNHHKYIETMYEMNPNTITENLQTIITESIETMAPVKIVQISSKNKNKLSEKARESLANRDLAFQMFKQTNAMEDLRNYRHVKNTTNRLISEEKFKRKSAAFKDENLNINDRWKLMKDETGQSNHSSPQVVIEGDKHYTKHIDIANSLNRQYVRKINKLIENMEESDIDPLSNYTQSIGPKGESLSFTFTQINMNDLRKTLHEVHGFDRRGRYLDQNDQTGPVRT